MKKLVLHMESLESETKDVFSDSFHEDLVALIKDGGEYDDMEVKGMEINLEQLAEDIICGLDENEKVMDVAENLEDTATILEDSGSDTISPTEAQLMAVSANMGVAGTDSDAADLAPALEAFKDKKVAIEQLREKNRVAIEGIVESIKNIASKLADVIKGLFNYVYAIEKRISNIKDLVSSLSNKKQKEVTVKINKNVFLRKNTTDTVSGADEYKSLLTETVSFFDSFSTVAIKTVSGFTNSYKNYFSTLPGTTPTFVEAARLYKIYMDNLEGITKIPGLTLTSDPSSSSKNYTSEYLLGGAAVRVALAEKVEVTEENIPKLKNTLTNSGVVFFRFWSFDVDTSGEKTIDFTVTQKYLQDLIKLSEKSVTIYKKFLNSIYKSNVFWSFWRGLKTEWNGKLMSLHTLILNRGTNTTNVFLSYSKEYSKLLCSSPLDLVEKLAKDKAWNAEAPAA